MNRTNVFQTPWVAKAFFSFRRMLFDTRRLISVSAFLSSLPLLFLALACEQKEKPLTIAQAQEVLQTREREVEAARALYRRQFAKVKQEGEKRAFICETLEDKTKRAKCKKQIDIYLRGIVAAEFRHKMEAELLALSLRHIDEIRQAMALLRKAKTKPATKLSAYVSHAFFDDFDEKAKADIALNQKRAERWAKEKEKWRTRFGKKDYSYEMPDIERGRFLFDYDSMSDDRSIWKKFQDVTKQKE